MTFPAEPIPDGSFFLPHHFLYPLYVVLLLYVLKLKDDADSESAAIPTSAVVALVGWFHFWPYYPEAGAIIALVGVVGVVGGAVVHSDLSNHWRVSVVALGILAFDDWISHAIGVQTPAGVIYRAYIHSFLL